MATRTSSQNGNLSNPATWGGSAFADGDTIVANHNVNVDVNAIIGTSPSDTTTMAITIASAKTLTVNAGIELKVRGNVTSVGNSGGIILGASSVWEWDASQAVTPATKYLANLGTGFTGNGVLTVGSGAIVRSNAGGGNGRFTYTNSPFNFTATSATFLRLGDNVDLGIRCLGAVALTDVLFDTCGLINGAGSNTNISWVGVRFENSNPATDGSGFVLCVKIGAGTAAGTKLVERCSFDKRVGTGGNGISYVDCYFDDLFSTGAVFSANPWAAMTGCTLRDTTNQGDTAGGPMTDCYMICDDTDGNPHFVNPIAGTYGGLVFDYPHPFNGDFGDCFLRNSTGGLTITIRDCLVVPSFSDGKTSGYLATMGNTGTVKLLHNTLVGEHAMGAFIRDHAPTGVIWTEIKSNLVVELTGASGDNRAAAAFDLNIAGTPDDVATGSGCTHNGFYNPITFTDTTNGSANYSGYKMNCPTSGTPGSNDIIADPAFVDPTRNVVTYAVYKGWASSGDTLRQKLDALRVQLKADPTLGPDDMRPWVRGGYMPTNEVYRDSGHDGVTRGAIEMAELAVATSNLLLLGVG